MAYMVYYKSHLTPKEKKAYDAFVDGIIHRKDEITLPRVSSKELERIYFALNYDYPDFFYTDFIQYSYTTYFTKTVIKMPYLMSYDEALLIKKKIDIVANEIVAGANGLSIVKTIEYFHNELVKRSIYSTETTHPLYAHNLIGPFLEGKCVCEGYAKAFKYLCDLVGIKCILATGIAGLKGNIAQRHAWNIVRIGEQSYHIDVTFDEICGEYISKAYLFLSEEEICRDHQLDTTFPLPECNSNKCPVPVITGTKNLVNQLRIESEKNKKYSEIRITKHFTPDEITSMIGEEITENDVWVNRLGSIKVSHYSIIFEWI